MTPQRPIEDRCLVLSDAGDGDWWVQSWYEDGEHRMAFARGAGAFRCPCVCRASESRCNHPVTPGRLACRYHGGHWLRGSNPVVAKVGPRLELALLERKRTHTERQLEDVEAALEVLCLDIGELSVWPPIEY